jgi:acyl-CoA dehydrogenase
MDVAQKWADDVDVRARFPEETLEALGAAGLLGALIPENRGGPGATLVDASQAVSAIAQYCASSGLIFAMHLIQVAYLERHASAKVQRELYPRILAGDLLLANANSEVGLEGERRTSICALEPVERGFRLRKRASTVSFGEYSGAVLATARRTPDSPANDQVLVICAQPGLKLTPTDEWDTLGLRGTCSRPALIEAELPPEYVIGDYGEIMVRTALPVGNVLTGSTWVGIAEAAAKGAHASVRAEGRRQRAENPQAEAPLSALRLAELNVILHQLREVIHGGAVEYERVKDTPEVDTLTFSTRMDTLKVSVSTLSLDVVQRAMAICGLGGYKNHAEFSMARYIRDVIAAPLMVNNDRSLQGNARSLLIRKEL